ncbi:reticulon-2 isoform X4 [Phaenicophaeus curvirostris]|uniref:reticulon-2 isoform X4 n=1 Tax=Phaenicophaeus curvirostris TaxID=33595 RepID=UPI0037F0BEE8
MEGQVWALLSWRAPGPSALALVASLATLGSLARFGVVTVGSHAALAVLAVTVPRRLYRAGVRSLRRLPATPARTQPEGPVGLSPEQQQLWARRLARHLSAAKHTLTRLFLVHSLPESLKAVAAVRLLFLPADLRGGRLQRGDAAGSRRRSSRAWTC